MVNGRRRQDARGVNEMSGVRGVRKSAVRVWKRLEKARSRSGKEVSGAWSAVCGVYVRCEGKVREK